MGSLRVHATKVVEWPPARDPLSFFILRIRPNSCLAPSHSLFTSTSHRLFHRAEAMQTRWRNFRAVPSAEECIESEGPSIFFFFCNLFSSIAEARLVFRGSWPEQATAR